MANDLRVIAAVYVGSLFVAAGIFSLAEGRDYFDSLWWCVVTALTIGYGDISPATGTGRVAAVVFQHFWIFGIAPLIVVNIIIRVARDKDQYTHAEQEWIEESILRIATKLDVELPAPPVEAEFGPVTPDGKSGDAGTAAAPASSGTSPATDSGTSR
ncbi:MAG: potassium channel family protein [Micromonosporaceae bacterium]